jgi:hypothetical protein
MGEEIEERTMKSGRTIRPWKCFIRSMIIIHIPKYNTYKEQIGLCTSPPWYPKDHLDETSFMPGSAMQVMNRKQSVETMK